MLKTQKNDVLEMIVDVGLQPTDFRWGSTERIEYAGPGATAGEFFFDFSVTGAPACNPGDFKYSRFAEDTDWDRVSRWFAHWLDVVAPEVAAPDLWEELTQLRSIVQDTDATTDDRADLPLIGKELEQLREAINHVRELAAARGDLTDDKLRAMHASLDRIEQSAGKYSRKDLVLLVLGSVAIPLVLQKLPQVDAQWLLAQLLNAFLATHVIVGPVVHALTK
jgi:hypothetical protein